MLPQVRGGGRVTCELRADADRRLERDGLPRVRLKCADDLRPRSHRGRMEKARKLGAECTDGLGRWNGEAKRRTIHVSEGCSACARIIRTADCGGTSLSAWRDFKDYITGGED